MEEDIPELVNKLTNDVELYFQTYSEPFRIWCFDNDNKAPFCLWYRQWFALRALNAMRNGNHYIDFYTIFRVFVEVDVSLEAVLKYKEVADDYVAFEKHAKATFFTKYIEKGLISTVNKKEIEAGLVATLGSDFREKYKWDKWCTRHGGTGGLLRKLGRDEQPLIYAAFSHVVHGSIMGLNTILKTPPEHRPIHMFHYYFTVALGSFLMRTDEFIKKYCAEKDNPFAGAKMNFQTLLNNYLICTQLVEKSGITAILNSDS